MISIEDFRKIQFKIAEIISVSPHPNADKLYVLEVKVGDQQKTLVAGIRPFYSEDELKGKKVVVVDNLEPASIRGVESQGMILAASTKETLSIISPERPIPNGTNVR